jgi:hypothetical protein
MQKSCGARLGGLSDAWRTGGQQSGKSNSQWAHGLWAEEYLQTRKLISELTRASDGSF